MVSGIASRFRADRAVDAFAQVHRTATTWCATLCSSYEFSFSVGWSERGARLWNAAFAHGWAGDLDAAITDAALAYRAAARELWEEGEDDGAAGASVIAVAFDGALHVRWLGDHAALLVRDGAVVAATEPHTLAREIAKHGVDPVGHPQATIVMKTLTTDEIHEFDKADWECGPGDRVIVASGDVMHALRGHEIAALGDAERIIDAVVARRDAFGVIVIAIGI